MKTLKLMKNFFGSLLVGCLLWSNADAQYTRHNSPMDSLILSDSFYVSYSIGLQKDSTIIKDTFILIKQDTFFSYHTSLNDIITDGVHTLLVQHSPQRIVFGPETPGLFNRYAPIQLADTNQLIALDSTDSISGFRIYTLYYDSIPGWPYCSKIIKLNKSNGFAEEIVMNPCNGLTGTTFFNILNVQTSGSIIAPMDKSQFITTSGAPSTWSKKIQYNAYQFINYY